MRSIGSLLWLIIALSASCSSGALAAPATLLADFETAESLALWEGLAPFRQTDAHASSGMHAMAVEIPKWNEEKGEDPRPRVRLAHAGGKGYPEKDWSKYEAVAIDIWVDGAEMGGFGLKLEDSSGLSSWTTWIDAKPGRIHEAVLPMEEAAGDIDITDVQAVVLYALRPPYPFTITVDRLRLLPRKPVPAADFVLRYPNYRNMILSGESTVEAGLRVNADAYGYRLNELRVRLTLEGPGFLRTASLPVRETQGGYGISCANAPEGPLSLRAEVIRKRNQAVLGREQWELRRLSPAELATMPVYIDRRNNTIVDGKPFFPLGFFTNSQPSHIEEIADSPFNTVLMYGTNHIPKAQMLPMMDSIHAKNLKLIYCMNDAYPRATYHAEKGWEGIMGNEGISNAVVDTYKSHPAVLSWYLNDELPREQQSELLDYYRRVRDRDPGHPTLITLCQKKDFSWLWQTTDILSGDPYPIPRGTVSEAASAMLKAKEPSMGAQPVWMVPQAFAWYQHDPKNTDRARIPSAKDLETGRAPTYEEGRCMSYLGLVHGAKGLIYWCYYNMRVLPQYEDMWAWMKSIGHEIRELEPVLLEADDLGPVSMSPNSDDIHSLLKRSGNTFTLLAVNTASESRDARFQVPVSASAQVEVQFENRAVSARKGEFGDRFAPLAVHVYRWTAK